jgi:hypothetical protein
MEGSLFKRAGRGHCRRGSGHMLWMNTPGFLGNKIQFSKASSCRRV